MPSGVGRNNIPDPRLTYGMKMPQYNLAPPAPAGPPPAGLQSLRAVAGITKYVLPAALLAATAIVNEPGIAQAATNWGSGLAMPLDDGVKMTSPNIINESRKNWKAEDQEAFEAAVARLSSEVAKLRHSLGSIGGTMDEVGGTIRKYWMEIGAMAIVLMSAALIVNGLKMLPQTRLLAALKEAIIGKLAWGTTAGLLLQLGLLFGSSARTIAMETRKWHQFQYVHPSGKSAIDFNRARIDIKDMPSFHKREKPGELPKGSDTFEWIAPERETPAP